MAATHHDRETGLRWTEFAPPADAKDDGRDVIAGLGAAAKYLPSRYFYDDAGSALFARITGEPEYYLTRMERSLLARHAEAIALRTGAAELIELGSGDARKTRTLIEAYGRRGLRLRYLPVDVSAGILKDAARALLQAYPTIDVWALAGTYEQALAELPPAEIGTRMVLFLGSTIGNLNPAELADFLDRVRATLRAGQYFLVGVDLRKPAAVLEAAYNDSAGVTAAFNLNILRHLNRRFAGDFDLSAFAHRAFYNREMSRIEMHLVSRVARRVRLRALDFSCAFAEGETIHTEISRKFHLPELLRTFAEHGFVDEDSWTDPDRWYALILLRAVADGS